MLPNAEVIATSLEFGTYSPPEVLWALRAENYVHHHGGWKYPEATPSKDALKSNVKCPLVAGSAS